MHAAFVRVTTAKSHSSTCGWSSTYRELVANQFPYILAISINWPLISSKRQCCSFCSCRVLRAVTSGTSACTRVASPPRERDIRLVLSRTRGIPFIGIRTGKRLLRLSRINPRRRLAPSQSAICCAIAKGLLLVGS